MSGRVFPEMVDLRDSARHGEIHPEFGWYHPIGEGLNGIKMGKEEASQRGGNFLCSLASM